MNPTRLKALRVSLERELLAQTASKGSTRAIQLKWVTEQLENYLERWLGFCAVPSIPMSSLVEDDLVGMIGIGLDVLTQRLGETTEFSTTKNSLCRLQNALRNVRQNGNRQMALQLRDALAVLKQSLEADLKES